MLWYVSTKHLEDQLIYVAKNWFHKTDIIEIIIKTLKFQHNRTSEQLHLHQIAPTYFRNLLSIHTSDAPNAFKVIHFLVFDFHSLKL